MFNGSKNWFILSPFCDKLDPLHWPLKWGNKIENQERKSQKHIKMRMQFDSIRFDSLCSVPFCSVRIIWNGLLNGNLPHVDKASKINWRHASAAIASVYLTRHHSLFFFLSLLFNCCTLFFKFVVHRTFLANLLIAIAFLHRS